MTASLHPLSAHPGRHAPIRPLRRSVQWPCQVVRERDFRLIGRHIVDLSERGMLVGYAERVLTGEPVIISFQAPLSTHWVDVEGTVVRVVHGRRLTDRGRCLGIAFEHIDGRTSALLCQQLGWFRPVSVRLRASLDRAS